MVFNAFWMGCNVIEGDSDKVELISFCVGLTVLLGGRMFYFDFMYSEAADWAEILDVAEQSINFWKADILKSPRAWKLDDNLRGAVLRMVMMRTMIMHMIFFGMKTSTLWWWYLVNRRALHWDAEIPRKTRSLSEHVLQHACKMHMKPYVLYVTCWTGSKFITFFLRMFKNSPGNDMSKK